MAHGRKEEALNLLQRAARVNGRMISDDLQDKVSCITLIKRMINLSMICDHFLVISFFSVRWRVHLKEETCWTSSGFHI